jgi:uncharacterized protein (DUF983 family)
MPPWLIDGIKSKCPHCHEGDLFAGILKLATNCPKCGTSFKDAETADGPAFFVMTIAGFLLTPVLLVLLLGFKLSPLILMAIMTPLTLVTCIGLLRPFKASIYALQIHKRFKEAKAKDYEHLQK